MEERTESGDTERGIVATNVVDAVIACLLIAFGAIVVSASVKLGSGWTSNGPGAGYFPFYIGLILCISGLGILYQAVRGKQKNTEPFVNHEQLKQVMSVLIPAAVYVGGIQVVGIYVASAVYIALFMIILGKYSWLKSVIASVVIAALFFMLFEVWFQVPLYKGMLNPLGFLGY